MTIKGLGSVSAWYAKTIRDQLLIATYEGHPPDVRKDAMEAVWTLWPKLCRSMSDLEGLCPNTVRAGSMADADQLEEIEAMKARPAQ